MEHIQEIITGLFNSPEVIALLTAVFAWFSANLGTIIVFACKYLKLKNKEVREKMLHEQTIEALTKGYEEKVKQLTDNIDSKLEKLDNHVCQRMDENEELRKEEIKNQSIQLQAALDETKKSLSIDEILEQE